MKDRNLIIIGASASAKIARFYFERDTEFKVHGYAVQESYMTKETLYDGLPVVSLEKIVQTHPPTEFQCFVAVGYSKMNSVREKLYKLIKELGYILPNYISPRSSFLTNEEIGDNNLILEDNTIQPFVKIGSNNVFWSGNHIGHDVEIGSHNFISSHVVISGYTKVGNNCFFGVNSTFRDSITIGNKNLIAAGAIIMNSTNDGDVYVPPRSSKLDKKSDDLNF